MSNSASIHFDVELDDESIPEKIHWKASDQEGEPAETTAISVAIWDPKEKNTMRIDLWTKDMPVDEMKGFYINALAGMAESLEASTGDKEMSAAMIELCERFATREGE